jgi:DNA-binding transcriptional MerR regulator
MDKSPDAFRTISEVSEQIDTPAHVLRFWESRFPQIRPVKRAGGRRYYRPADVALLMGIKQLLHGEGLTIRGVQKLLREQGVRHVAGLSGLADLGETDDHAELTLEAALKANYGPKDSFDQSISPNATADIVDLNDAKLTRKFDEFDQSNVFLPMDPVFGIEDDAPRDLETPLDQDVGDQNEDVFFQSEAENVDDSNIEAEVPHDGTTPHLTPSVADVVAPETTPIAPAPQTKPVKQHTNVADLIDACVKHPRHSLAAHAAELAPVLHQLSALARKMAAPPQYPQG